MTSPTATESRRQALRMRRFLIASTTYVLGFVMLALCSAIDLFPAGMLLTVGVAFLAVNVVFFSALRSGFNLRFDDPSLTLAQLCAAASTVTLVLVLGEKIHFVAVPFYSSLFVFAMLQLRRRQLIRFEAFVLVTYGVAFAIRTQVFAGRLDLRVEALHAALVVLSSLWFALAADYISQLRARLRESVQTIEHLATRDALTDTWNRRHIDNLLAQELQRKSRFGAAVCVCLLDLDYFKSVNDRFGHLTGDAVLAEVARRMKDALRSIDQLGRFGGEEFLIVLPGTTLRDAQVCAERLRAAVGQMTVPEHPEAGLSISIGLAEAEPGETSSTLLTRVDAALYRAKHEGRDRIVVADGGPQRALPPAGAAGGARRKSSPSAPARV